MLIDLIDLIREDDVTEGLWHHPGQRKPVPDPYSLTISLARFQSYRRRTEAALIQEIEDWVEENGFTQFLYRVNQDDGTVVLW